DRHRAVARRLDVQALVDDQLAAGQRDGLTRELAGEMDPVAGLGGGDFSAKRALPAVQGVGDSQRAEKPAIAERRGRGPEGCPPSSGAIHTPALTGGGRLSVVRPGSKPHDAFPFANGSAKSR